MAEDTAILDAPAADATPGVETPDLSTGLEETSDLAPESTEEPGAEGTPGAGEAPAGAESAVIDGKRLSESAKAAIAEIKAKDPKLALEIKRALFSADALHRAAPGGVREISELRRQVEDLGGTEGIQGLRAEQQAWAALDEQFSAGDPNFIANIAEESPDAFLKLAPTAFQKFQELHPEGYSAYVSQVFVADMQQEGIPLAIE
ncbi:MAG: hypothetical protein ACRD19_14970, partial [Terriglobia bacterium]